MTTKLPESATRADESTSESAATPADEPKKETRASRTERDRAERADATARNAATLAKHPAKNRRAVAALAGWSDADTKRALQGAALIDQERIPADSDFPGEPLDDASSQDEPPSGAHAKTAADGRIAICHNPARYYADVLATVEALADAGDVFVSGPRLVRVARVTPKEQNQSAWKDDRGRERFAVVAGAPYIAPFSLPVLKMKIAEHVAFQRFVLSRGGWIDSAPPDDVVSALFDLRDWNLPRIVGIAETPLFRVDGTIASMPGYDAATGYFLAPSAKFPNVPIKPTKDQAVAAYRALEEIFVDFPFVDVGQRAVAVAAILTVIARAAIRGSVPGFVFDAANGGVGKTLQTDAISIIATGRPAARKAYPSEEAEIEKSLSAYALRGSTLIAIDDVKRALGGENLDRVLTARDEVDFRKLGKTELLTMPWVATLLFTGCNISYFGQMARRVVTSRVESTMERPQDRSDFKHGDLLEWLYVERPRLVSAALTLLRAFAANGYPDVKTKRWGSFEEWSRLIPAAIVFAGGPDVLAFRPPDDDDDAVSDAAVLRAALVALEALFVDRAPGLSRKLDGSDGLTSAEIVEVFRSRDDEHASARAAIRDLCRYRGADGGPSAGALGSHLARHKGRPLRIPNGPKPEDGARLVRLVKIKDSRKTSADRWGMETLK